MRQEGEGKGVETVAPVLPGAVPATGFLRQSGIGLDSRGFIPVNKVGLGVGRWARCWWRVAGGPSLGALPTTSLRPSPHR